MNKTMKLILLIFITSFLSVCIVFSQPSHIGFELVLLLPISFSIFSLFFNKILTYFGKSIAVTCILICLYLKNVITPALMALSTYSSYSVQAIDKNMNLACILLIYETFMIFVVLYFLQSRLKSIKPMNVNKSKIIIPYSREINFAAVLMIFIVIVLGYRYKSLWFFYDFTFSSNDLQQNLTRLHLQTYAKNSVPTLFYYLFSFLSEIIRFIFPLFLFVKIFNKQKISEYMKVFLSVIVVVLFSMISSDTKAVSVFLLVSWLIWLMNIYYRKRRIIARFILIGVAIMGIGGLMYKSIISNNKEIAWISLNNMIQAYSGGPNNVSIALNIKQNISIEQFLGDTLKYIPYIMHYFQSYTSSNGLFNAVFWGSELAPQTQIMPTISQCSRYFTIALSPLFSMIFVHLAVINETKISKENELKMFLRILICVVFIVGIYMYNASLILSFYFKYIFILQILLAVSGKRRSYKVENRITNVV